MSRNTLIGIIVALLLILLASVYYTLGRRSNQELPDEFYTSLPSDQGLIVSPQPTPSSFASSPATLNNISPVASNTVTYTDSGFSPATLTVPTGTTVTFVNQSTKGVWVASNPHPTHTDYPGLDAKKTYNPGESYSFTFTKPGTWGYHNHLSATQTGTIVVQ